jgi:hypothetical protein
MIGAVAIGGSFALSWLKARLGPDGLVAFASLTAAFGRARDPIVALYASFVIGASWTLVLSSLYAAAQVALPDWMRARGLAIFLTVFFAAITVGSTVWGRVDGMEGLPVAHFLAAAGAVVAIPLTRRWKLATAFENEVHIAKKNAKYGSGWRLVDCCAGSEVHNTFSRYPTLGDLSVSGPGVGAGTRGDADNRDALRGYRPKVSPHERIHIAATRPAPRP